MRWFIFLCLWGVFITPTFSQSSSSLLDNLPDCNFTPLDNSMRVGAVILNLETGDGCTQDLDHIFNVASVPKVLVAGAFYDWMVQGSITTNTPITFSDNYYMGGRLDCLNADDVGTSYRARELIELMLNCSDNAATWMLMDAVGWLTVNNYIQNTGIPNIGEVIPYSEVDRLKLTMLNPEWADVPRNLASRYFRGGRTAGLDQYLTTVPTAPLTDEEEYLANSAYFLSYNTNTASPRAFADYFLQLRDALITDPNSQRGLVARLLFDAMLYTQRLNSVQALDGTVLVGGKNGFDRGVVAEANLLFNNLETRAPNGLVIIFTQQYDLNAPDVQEPSPFRGTLNAYVRELSPQIHDILYPNASNELSPLNTSLNISSVTLQTQDNIQQCWDPYFVSEFSEDEVEDLEDCFQRYESRQNYVVGDNFALGMILRSLGDREARFVFVYTAPDGTMASYQTDREYKDKAGVYWYHPVTQSGTWRVDIYMNMQRVYSQLFFVAVREQ
jgi:beta-lactamase class A